MKILLSIVIANYNYGRFLAEAIKSVLKQCDTPVKVDGRTVLPIRGGLDAVELIICDAASTDNSVEVIKKYERCIAWWCSEPDAGQSAAFNKGFRQAKGEWLTWLNADELYAAGTLDSLLQFIKMHPRAKWITGNYVNFDDKSKKITHVTWGPHFCIPFLTKKHYPNAVFGSTSFWKRELYEEVGPIDEQMRYGMDTEYWNRLTMAGYKHLRLNHYCWLFRDHDASKTVGVQNEQSIERRRKEDAYQRVKTGYNFRYSFSNVWFCVWFIWRILDLSLFVRSYRRWRLIGRDIGILQ